jgi:hypothetical protein
MATTRTQRKTSAAKENKPGLPVAAARMALDQATIAIKKLQRSAARNSEELSRKESR